MGTKHEDDDDLHTLWAWRLTKEKVDFWKSIFHMALIMLGFSLGLSMCGALNYYNCRVDDHSISVMQCFKLEDRIKHGKKEKNKEEDH